MSVATVTALVGGLGWSAASSSTAAASPQKPTAPIHATLADATLAPAAVTPDAGTQPAAADQHYSVVSGDTLSGIAQRFYQASDRWPQIAQANPFIANPNLIYPGQSLRIPNSPVAAPPAPAADPKPVAAATHHAAPAHASTGWASSSSLGGIWACIRQHESGGNYSSAGYFYGAYQFLPSTWNATVTAMGMSQYANGRANTAPPAVQDQAAQYLQAHSGWGQWPVTSRMCGAR
jgi:LysM repeat protein